MENVIERAVVLNPGGTIELEDLPADFSRKREEIDVNKFIPANAPLQQTLEQIEEQLMRRALTQCNNIQSHAADMLSITKSLFQHKMKKYKIVI